MTTTTQPGSTERATVGVASTGLSDTEWIVIVVILVIILVVLIIAIAKCLEIGQSGRKPKTLLQDGHSMRSETVRSATTRSIASTKKSNGGPMQKMPLNAEITRFSAGRVSRSAEYGVVIKDIRKAINNGEERMSPPPSYVEQTNTLHTYRPQQQVQPQPQQVIQQQPVAVHTPHHTPIIRRHNTLTSPPNANLIVNQQYASQGLAPANSKAVFIADDGFGTDGANVYANNTLVRQQIVQPQMVMQTNPVVLDVRYPMLAQPAVIMQ